MYRTAIFYLQTYRDNGGKATNEASRNFTAWLTEKTATAGMRTIKLVRVLHCAES